MTLMRVTRRRIIETIKTLLICLAYVALLTLAGTVAPPDDAQAREFKPAPPALVAAAQKSSPMPRAGTKAKRAWVICSVFGHARKKCQRALNVAWCESTLNPSAANGQYRGTFQMGRKERTRWGYGSTIWKQARGAKRYRDSRGHWGAWSCRSHR